MGYPATLDEFETVARAAAGASLARYGDGEFNLALGGNCVSQVGSPAIAAALRAILAEPKRDDLLVCLPNLGRNAKPDAWKKFDRPDVNALMGPGPYGSAFISRPDSAPWIDVPDYWDQVRGLWAGRDVVFVRGGGKATERSLRLENFGAARSVVSIEASGHRDAFEEIDQLERLVRARVAHLRGQGPGPHFDFEPLTPRAPLVILCLGACGTILAHRLAPTVQALDLGHIGMFMRSAGAYRWQLDDLASPGYRRLCVQMHARRWGADGAKHLDKVLAYAEALHAETVLDYGCGEARLCEAAKPYRRILNYDPGVAGREGMPKPVDLVVSTDVLEHVEPAKLPAVLDHICRLAQRGALLVIATRPAKAVLPDGRNAHLIVQDADWWRAQLEPLPWLIERCDVRPGKDMTVWLRK